MRICFAWDFPASAHKSLQVARVSTALSLRTYFINRIDAACLTHHTSSGAGHSSFESLAVKVSHNFIEDDDIEHFSSVWDGHHSIHELASG